MAEGRSPARSPAPGSEAARGAALFQSAGCAACHRIEGTEANGLAGPDLTYMASRSSIGAGILPNNRGTLIGWIGDSQSIKPGNRMPPYSSSLSGPALQALATFIEAQRLKARPAQPRHLLYPSLPVNPPTQRAHVQAR